MSVQKIVAGCLVLPIPSAVWSSYLYASRLTRKFSLFTDYTALAIALAIGVVGVFMLTRSGKSRMMATAVYLALTGLGMYWGMVATVCSRGDCP